MVGLGVGLGQIIIDQASLQFDVVDAGFQCGPRLLRLQAWDPEFGRIGGQRHVGELRPELRFRLLEFLGGLVQLRPGVGQLRLLPFRVLLVGLGRLDQLLGLLAQQFARRRHRKGRGRVVRVLFEKLRQVALRLLHHAVVLPAVGQFRRALEALGHFQFPNVSQLLRHVSLIGQHLQVIDCHVAIAVLLERVQEPHGLRFGRRQPPNGQRRQGHDGNPCREDDGSADGSHVKSRRSF